MNSPNLIEWQKTQRLIEILSLLNYRADNLDGYLKDIACGVSELVGTDWSVVTLRQGNYERVMASSIDIGEGEHLYSLHGTLTNVVMEKERSLAIADARNYPEYGDPPEGYLSYLGVPLRTAKGVIIGTICSFNMQPRSYTPEEVRTVELFADRAASAIDNFRMYQKMLAFNEELERQVEARTQELCEVQTQLVEKERLAAIGEFAAGIVHEVRNPLTTVKMGLGFFNRLELPPSAVERLMLAVTELERLERLLSEILLYAKPQALQPVEIEINRFIQQWLCSVEEMPEAAKRKIVFIPTPSTVNIIGDRDKLRQVFLNILRNACEAAPEGSIVEWRLEKAANEICLRVHNDGDPIPPNVLPNLTKPFCSTKASGTGLGLAIVKRIANIHGGDIDIQSDAVSGTTVSICLPIIEDASKINENQQKG